MAYYVSLGPRGYVLRIGTRLIGFFNGMVYGLACRRRRRIPHTATIAVVLPVIDRPIQNPKIV